MRKILATLAVVMIAAFAFAAPAAAQDEGDEEGPVIGSITVTPPAVPAAGEYEVTANGAGYIPDTTILVGTCTIPGDPLVLGVATLEQVSEGLGSMGITDCDLATASTVFVESDGTWELEKTVTVGDNFAFTAAAIDQSQQGATWLPVGDPALLATLAVTGVESWGLALIGIGMLALGAAALAGSRRFNIA
ncbi:MAG: hypothetical protein ACR2P0_13025 [Acidimicrobiales bacterium]